MRKYSDGGTTDYSHYVTAVAALFNQQGDILILQRGSTAPWMPNAWSLVGGVVDEGENPDEAIVREIMEETGLQVLNLQYKQTKYTKDAGKIVYYAGMLPANFIVRLDYENQDFAFVNLSNIDQYEYVPHVKAYMRNLLEPPTAITKLAEGGIVKKYGFTEAEIDKWEKENKVSQRKTQNPVVKEAITEMAEGKLTQDEYLKILQENNPIKPFDRVPPLPTLKEIVGSLKTNQLEKQGIIGYTVEIPDGAYVASRLDIPAYDNYDVWVVSVHDGNKEKNVIGYGKTAYLKNVTFKSSPKTAMRIGMGLSSKSTFARMYGTWVNKSPEVVRNMAVRYMNNPNWIQVGMNPYRHSWFYDKADGLPLVSAEEVIQVGALVLAKNAVKTTVDDPEFIVDKENPAIKYSDGGNVKNQSNSFSDKTYKLLVKATKPSSTEINKKNISQSDLTDILKKIGREKDFINYANQKGRKNYICEYFDEHKLTHGFCNPLAYYLMDRYNDLSVFSAKNDVDGNHLFVKLGDKYFDGKNIYGVNNPRDLDFFSNKNISIKLLETNDIDNIYAQYLEYINKPIKSRTQIENDLIMSVDRVIDEHKNKSTKYSDGGKTGSVYYRATSEDMGKQTVFTPVNKYEAFDDEGNPLTRGASDVFVLSDIPEISASKTIGGAILGLWSMFNHNGINPVGKKIYIYEIMDRPRKDLSHVRMADFEYLKEVRYDKPVNGVRSGYFVFDTEFNNNALNFYERLNDDDPYSETQYDEDAWYEFEKYILTLNNNDIVKYADGGKTDTLLAPNGKPSNLTHEQWHLVRTPAFKAWFGDWENSPETASKVVDENGEPLVVYHGTLGDLFYEFMPSAIEYVDGKPIREFRGNRTDEEFDEYIKQYGLRKTPTKFWFSIKPVWGNKFLPCFLNIRNLFIAKDIHTKIPIEFDGFIVPDDEDANDYYCVSKSTQIKLADGSNTTFDGNNPDIRYAEGGKVEQKVKYENGSSILDKTAQEIVHYYNDTSGFNSKEDAIEEIDYLLNTDFPHGFKNIPNVVVLYRVVLLENGDNVRVYDIGEHYIAERNLIDRGFLEKIGVWDNWSEETELILLTCETEKNNIDIERSIGNRLLYPREHEFTVIDDTKVSIIKTESISKKWVEYADGGKTDVLLAPNGKKSNLTPEQWHLVRTPAFKAWFGDWENSPETASKVVDENGEPLVCYHATPSNWNIAKIMQNDIGVHFGTKAQAEDRMKQQKIKNYIIIEAFLNAKYPIYSIDKKSWFGSNLAEILSKNKIEKSDIMKNELDVLKAKYKYDETGKIVNNWSEKALLEWNDNNKKRLYLSKYDSIIYINKYEDKLNRDFSYILFYPTQIKLADGSNTTFDGSNPDIRYADGGMTYQQYRDSQFDEQVDRHLPSGYLGEFEIKLNTKSNYPILYLEKDGYEYRLKNKNDSAIGVFHLNKQVGYADNKAIHVAPMYQKKGIGLNLVSILKERNPNHRFGSMTPEGFNLMGKYYDEKIKTNPDIGFAKGGKINIDDYMLVTYHEKVGNWAISKNEIYLWLYDDMDAGNKLQSGEFDYVLFPPRPPIQMAFKKNYVPPLLQVWTKKYQNRLKGSEKLMAIIRAWYDETNHKLYILMMTTRKDLRKRGIISSMIKELRKKFNIEQEDVIFDDPTEEGKAVMESKKFDKGGKTETSRPYSNLDISRVKKGVVQLNSVHPKRITKIDDLPI